MKMFTQVKVLGMKSSKGTLDNGQSFDSTKVYVETSLDDSKGNAKGFAVAEYTLGLADEFGKYKHLSFPFLADAAIEVVTNGKVQKFQLSDLKPTELVKNTPSKAS
jgi:hypothetical protein